MMKKSVAQWLRKLAVVGLASAGLITSNSIYAHDLPIFDSLTPLNCFGIGSCGFPSGGLLSNLPNEVAPINSTEVEESESPTSWSFSDCFGDSCHDPLGQAVSPEASSLSQGFSHDDLIEAESFDDQYFGAEQPTAFDSDLSYPLSYLSLIQSIGFRIPRFNLNETLKEFPKAILGMYQDQQDNAELVGAPAVEANYLNTRPLVDDYLDGESFVRDWRSDQSYRGLNRFDYLVDDTLSESLAVAVPKRPRLDAGPWLEEVLHILSDFQCSSSQELRDFHLTGHFSRKVGRSLANFAGKNSDVINQKASSLLVWASKPQPASNHMEFAQLDSLFGQPAFVIYQLEGKEFLLPAKQARHWNSVPAFQSRTDRLQAESEVDRDFAAVQSILVSELAISVSDGLELVATQLQQFASRLRAVAQEESQVANRSEAEGIRERYSASRKSRGSFRDLISSRSEP
jgi:hypothetical protein